MEVKPQLSLIINSYLIISMKTHKTCKIYVCSITKVIPFFFYEYQKSKTVKCFPHRKLTESIQPLILRPQPINNLGTTERRHLKAYILHAALMQYGGLYNVTYPLDILRK